MGDHEGDVGVVKRIKLDHESHKDDPYFRSYADVGIHQEMIGDTTRTSAYRWAILKNYKLFYGKVVADIGAGTGILSMFCVQAGAKKVYAVEASDMAEQMRLVIRSNGMEDRVTVVHGRVEDVTLPEKVDIIVSEWMGYFLLYESMLASVVLARDNWLKQGGIVMPSIAKIYLVPLTDEDFLDDGTAFWDDVKGLYGIDMTALKPYTRVCHRQRIHIQSIPPEAVMARPIEICSLMLDSVTAEDLQCIQGSFKFPCFGSSTIHGFGAFFKVFFPSDIILSTSPYDELTHWQHAVMYIDEPLNVEQDDIISGSLTVKPNSRNHRFLDIDIQFLHKNSEQRKHYLMDDFIS